ncbi:MAG: tetratricopeptide repeat protein [Planctomycetota bacterium]
MIVGCAGSATPQRVETPVNVTHEVAFGDYRRVYNTAYHILNRYGVIQTASYRYGKITALVSEDTSLYDKTRRTIEALIRDRGDYFEVECRVLIKVEQSEVSTFQDQFQQPYEWYTVASDPRLEVRLNTEIRGALSGGAWEAKQPLSPRPIGPPPEGSDAPRRSKQQGARGAEGDTDEVRLGPGRDESTSPRDLARAGVLSFRHGDFARAERAFRETLEVDPRDPFALYLIAQAEFSQGRFADAATTLRRAIQTNPAWLQSDFDVRQFYGEGEALFSSKLSELRGAASEDAGLGLLLGYMQLYSADPTGALGTLDGAVDANGRDLAAELTRERALSVIESQAGLETF